MGKLLQKLVTGIVPNWLTKIKSSADNSPRKLLPYFKGSTHVSSSSSPSSSTRHIKEVPPLVADDNPDQSIEEEDDPSSKACAENSVISLSPSLTKKEWTSSMMPKPQKSTQNQDHQYQDHNDPHQPHHVGAKISSDQVMHERDTHSCTPPGTPSSRKHGTLSIHMDKHDHHPQQHQRNSKNQVGLEKRKQCFPEEDNHDHQEAGSGRHNVDRRELCDFLDLDREGNVCMREDNHCNYHDKDYSHEAEIEDEHYKNLYHDLLGLKRKSQYLQAVEEEEEEEEENEGGSHGSGGNIDMTEWGWKRRKGARGVMSCELPESICCIVGNGRAVVKHSQDPHMVLWESMVEMIVGNGLWELGSLEFLLFCYLSLNEPHLHPIIQSIFLQVLKDLEKI